MSSKARDFYHTQDELNLVWRYLVRSQVTARIELDTLSEEIESISESLRPYSPKIDQFIDLTQKKYRC